MPVFVGGLYDNTLPCSHPTVIIDKTLTRLTPTGSMRPDAPGAEDSVNSTMGENERG